MKIMHKLILNCTNILLSLCDASFLGSIQFRFIYMCPQDLDKCAVVFFSDLLTLK